MRRAAILTLLLGCTPASGDVSSSSTSTGETPASSSGAPDTSTTGTPTPPGSTGTPPSSTGAAPETSTGEIGDDESSTSNVSAGFITDPTGGGCRDKRSDAGVQHISIECSLQDQDCCPGEACKAWANDGGDAWNASVCRPLAPEAGHAGDPCVAENSPVTGQDSCDLGLMCWNVDADTLEGTCVQFCGANGTEPTCADPDETCSIANDGSLPLCLPTCDPLAPDCGDGFGCYPTAQQDFVCIREGDRVHIEGLFHPDCPAGTFRVSPDLFEGCSKDGPCCKSFCDQTAESPCAEGECLPYFELPPEIEPLGYCMFGS